MNTSSNTSSNFSTRAIKRVLRDLAEIEANPISGISVAMPNINNPFIMHGNIEIRDGIYEGILIHLVIHIPDEYPIKPPAVNIAPGLDFGHKYHEHIYDNQTYGNSICTDLTSNFAGHFSLIDSYGKPTRSGWTPSYTLSSVLIQLQVFFADPDLEKHMLPSDEEISRLKQHIEKFELDVKIDDGMGEERTVTHSRKHPYPPLSCETTNLTLPEEEKVEEVGLAKPVEINQKKVNPNLDDTSNGRGSHFSSSSTTITHNGHSRSPPGESKEERSFEKPKESVMATLESNDPEKKKATTFDWGKPLTKMVKSEALNDDEKSTPLNTNTITQIVRVVKPKQFTNDQADLKIDQKQGKVSDYPKKTFNKKDQNPNARKNTAYNYSYQRGATSSVNSQPNNSKSLNKVNYHNKNNDITKSHPSSSNQNGKNNVQSSTSEVTRNAKKLEIIEETKVPTDDSEANKNIGEWGKNN